MGAAFGAATLIIVAIIFFPSFLVSTETYISFFRSAKGTSFSAFWIFVLSSVAKVRVFSSFFTLPLTTAKFESAAYFLLRVASPFIPLK